MRNTYAYTTGNLPENAVATVQYTYDTVFPDRLLTARGKSVSYNNQGCPVSYDGKTYTWAIHQLIQIKKGAPVTGTETWSYIYNGKGQRIRKEYVFTPPIKGPALIEYIQTRTTYYAYDHSGRMVEECTITSYKSGASDTTTILYLYDASSIIGMVCNGTAYVFEKSVQGDILGIYLTNGTCAGTFAYDAFGNVTSSGTEATRNCHLRYRGYYYDEETGFYNLFSRYYDPQIGRFISPDNVNYLDPARINGLNLYAYCNNDPVNLCDPSGHSATASFLIGMGIAALAGALVGACSYAISEEVSYALTGEFSWSWSQFAGCILGGAIGGVVSYIFSGLNIMVSAGITGVASTSIGMALQNRFEGTDYSLAQITVISILNGLISASIAGLSDSIKIKMKGLNSGRNSYAAI